MQGRAWVRALNFEPHMARWNSSPLWSSPMCSDLHLTAWYAPRDSRVARLTVCRLCATARGRGLFGTQVVSSHYADRSCTPAKPDVANAFSDCHVRRHIAPVHRDEAQHQEDFIDESSPWEYRGTRTRQKHGRMSCRSEVRPSHRRQPQ